MSWTQKQIYFGPLKKYIWTIQALIFLICQFYYRFTAWFSSQCAQSTPLRPGRFPRTSTRRSSSGSPCTPPASYGWPSSPSTSELQTPTRWLQTPEQVNHIIFVPLSDPDHDTLHHNQSERRRDSVLSVQSQVIHHHSPPWEKCQKADNERSQEVPGCSTGEPYFPSERKLHRF